MGKIIDPRTYIVMDDCLSSKGSWMRDKPILELLFNGRHYEIMYILTMQFPLGIPPDLRVNFDYIFLMAEDTLSNLKRIFDHYAGCFPKPRGGAIRAELGWCPRAWLNHALVGSWRWPSDANQRRRVDDPKPARLISAIGAGPCVVAQCLLMRLPLKVGLSGVPGLPPACPSHHDIYVFGFA